MPLVRQSAALSLNNIQFLSTAATSSQAAAYAQGARSGSAYHTIFPAEAVLLISISAASELGGEGGARRPSRKCIPRWKNRGMALLANRFKAWAGLCKVTPQCLSEACFYQDALLEQEK